MLIPVGLNTCLSPSGCRKAYSRERQRHFSRRGRISLIPSGSARTPKIVPASAGKEGESDVQACVYDDAERNTGQVRWAFRRSRDFAAALGLTPRQHSTGARDRSLVISKRGDSYLRASSWPVVHGTRAVLRHAAGRDDGFSRWLHALTARKHVNVAVVALANKTARIAWALTRQETAYDPALAAATAA